MSANESGDLFDMAKDGTKIPKNAAKPNYISSVPRPDQKDQSSAGGLGHASLHQAADNATATTGFGEVVTAAGGELPEDIGQKYSRSGGKERGEAADPHGGRNLPSH